MLAFGFEHVLHEAKVSDEYLATPFQGVDEFRATFLDGEGEQLRGGKFPEFVPEFFKRR